MKIIKYTDIYQKELKLLYKNFLESEKELYNNDDKIFIKLDTDIFSDITKYNIFLLENESDNEKIGYVSYYLVENDSVLMESIFIKPKYRNRNFAEYLIKKSIKELKKEFPELKNLGLYIASNNKYALNLFKKFNSESITEFHRFKI